MFPNEIVPWLVLILMTKSFLLSHHFVARPRTEQLTPIKLVTAGEMIWWLRPTSIAFSAVNNFTNGLSLELGSFNTDRTVGYMGEDVAT